MQCGRELVEEARVGPAPALRTGTGSASRLYGGLASGTSASIGVDGVPPARNFNVGRKGYLVGRKLLQMHHPPPIARRARASMKQCVREEVGPFRRCPAHRRL